MGRKLDSVTDRATVTYCDGVHDTVTVSRLYGSPVAGVTMVT